MQNNQLASFEQLQDVDKEILNIEQTCQINLQVDEKQKRTPSLNLVCENHKMEIIMFNLNQTEFEQTNPFLCVECAQDLLTRGNKAVSNTISLRKAEDKWNDYIKDQSEKRSQRQTRLNQAIGFIKKLQEKYNQELNKMIQSLNDQLKKQPKEYEELMKLKNTRLQNQDKQSLLEIFKILGQTDQSKNREQISNQEDSEFYQSQKKVLEELIKENLLVENQIQSLSILILLVQYFENHFQFQIHLHILVFCALLYENNNVNEFIQFKWQRNSQQIFDDDDNFSQVQDNRYSPNQLDARIKVKQIIQNQIRNIFNSFVNLIQLFNTQSQDY